MAPSISNNMQGQTEKETPWPAGEGGEAESRFRWLVEFAQATGVPREMVAIRALQAQLGAYLQGVLIRCEGDAEHEPHRLRLGDSPCLNVPLSGADDHKPLDEKVALIRTTLVRTITDVLHPREPRLVPLTAALTVQRVLEEGQLREERIAGDIRDALQFRLLEDLSEKRARVKVCAEKDCGTFFVRQHRQEYCSTSCRNRANFRGWYARKKDKEKAGRDTPAGPSPVPQRPSPNQGSGTPTPKTKIAK